VRATLPYPAAALMRARCSPWAQIAGLPRRPVPLPWARQGKCAAVLLTCGMRCAIVSVVHFPSSPGSWQMTSMCNCWSSRCHQPAPTSWDAANTCSRGWRAHASAGRGAVVTCVAARRTTELAGAANGLFRKPAPEELPLLEAGDEESPVPLPAALARGAEPAPRGLEPRVLEPGVRAESPFAMPAPHVPAPPTADLPMPHAPGGHAPPGMPLADAYIELTHSSNEDDGAGAPAALAPAGAAAGLLQRRAQACSKPSAGTMSPG
jgi:hypothetical protein